MSTESTRDTKAPVVATLPKGWKWFRLDQACVPQLVKGEQGSTPYLEIGDINIIDKSYTCSSKEAVKGALIAERGDVLISRVRPTRGAIVVLRESQAHVSSALSILRPTPGVLSAYIFYFLAWNRNFAEYLGSHCTGTMYPTVSKDVVNSFSMPVAPLKEQHDIIGELEKQFSRLDEAVASLKRVKANLKRYKAAVLKAAVGGKLTEDWRKQHPDIEPASKLLQRILIERRAKWKGKGKYKEPTEPDTSDLPSLSESWTWAALDQVCTVERGRFSIRPRNDPRYYDGKHPFVQIGDLPREGGVITTYSQTLNEAGLGVSKKFSSGTILIAIVGATIANTGILGFDSCCPDSLVAIHSADQLGLRFVELYLRSKKMDLRRTSYASGGQPNINLTTLLPYPVPLPPLAEQHLIVAEVERRLSVIEELEAAVEANLTRADHLRQSVLTRAFEGKLINSALKKTPDSSRDFPVAAESPSTYRAARRGRRSR